MQQKLLKHHFTSFKANFCPKGAAVHKMQFIANCGLNHANANYELQYTVLLDTI